MRRAPRLLAAALLGGFAWGPVAPAAAAPRSIAAGPVVLHYDDELWHAQVGVAPALLTLDCLQRRCNGAAVVLVADPRPFYAPGAGGFTPGAVTALFTDLRAQDLAPGSRLRPETPTEPFRIGSISGYRGRFTVEDSNLNRTSLESLVIRHHGTALHLRLSAPALAAETTAVLDALAGGLDFAE